MRLPSRYPESTEQAPGPATVLERGGEGWEEDRKLDEALKIKNRGGETSAPPGTKKKNMQKNAEQVTKMER